VCVCVCVCIYIRLYERELWREGIGGGLINRFYCRFTQYRMEDPIMLDTSCINHRCSGGRARVRIGCTPRAPRNPKVYEDIRKAFGNRLKEEKK
jgi:hypothetical protein